MKFHIKFNREKIKKYSKGFLTGFLIFCFFALTFFFNFTSYFVDRSINGTVEHEPFYVTARAESLHDSLLIMDWHSEALLWDRSLLMRHNYGHVDIPRLREGNIALQMFTAVTKSPSGKNYERNSGDSDTITPLVISQLWHPKTWNSLFMRALYQAEKLKQFVDMSNGDMVLITSKADLVELMKKREAGEPVIGAMLGVEGAHALEGKLKNIDKLQASGFRMIGLTHFFDNDLGGSLHGIHRKGLTKFGHKAVARMIEQEIIIDLSHASEAMVKDVLAHHQNAALVVSHTGFKGVCDSPRNISDDLMKQIADRGGLIAIGYWQGAICDPTPVGIVKNILYGIKLVGADHIALGSDWDGATVAIQPQDMDIITQNLISAGVSYTDIAKVMGGNSVKFLLDHLPNK